MGKFKLLWVGCGFFLSPPTRGWWQWLFRPGNGGKGPISRLVQRFLSRSSAQETSGAGSSGREGWDPQKRGNQLRSGLERHPQLSGCAETLGMSVPFLPEGNPSWKVSNPPLRYSPQPRSDLEKTREDVKGDFSPHRGFCRIPQLQNRSAWPKPGHFFVQPVLFQFRALVSSSGSSKPPEPLPGLLSRAINTSNRCSGGNFPLDAAALPAGLRQPGLDRSGRAIRPPSARQQL